MSLLVVHGLGRFKAKVGAHGSLFSQAFYTIVTSVIESKPCGARAGWTKNAEELA
jgi:hypothetical protein